MNWSTFLALSGLIEIFLLDRLDISLVFCRGGCWLISMGRRVLLYWSVSSSSSRLVSSECMCFGEVCCTSAKLISSGFSIKTSWTSVRGMFWSKIKAWF